MSARGGVLLEILVAVAIFSMAALAIASALSDAAGGAARSRRHAQAVDLARSAMAQIEAGIASPETLIGPANYTEEIQLAGADDPNAEGFEGSSGFDEDPPEDTGWELEIDTRRSAHDGLTLVTVTAISRPSPDSPRVDASYTLRQLVRLRDATPEGIGQDDELQDLFQSGGAR